jgi:hypothetical protein
MKRLFLCCLLSLVLFSVSTSTLCAAKPAKVEILFMNHGPLMDTLNKVRGVLSAFGDKVSVSWYDFETKEGEQFMAKKGVRQHIPIVIWIDDSPVFKTDGGQITFAGFPTGSGPGFFQGKWTVDDLKSALDQATKKK